MKALVTGAAGFIGSHLCEALLAKGYAVRAMTKYNSSGHRGHLEGLVHPALEVIAGDVTDHFQMSEVVKGCDVVFHLAALIGIPYSYAAPASYVAVNVQGTVNILEACRREEISRVLVTSTSEVYGTARYEPIDEAHPLQGQSPYSASKIGADKLAEAYYNSFGLPVTLVRPFNTYGPRQSARAVIPTIASQVAAGLNTIRLGSLWPERDLMFVEDTAAGFIALAECPAAIGETVNLGTGRKISIGALADKMVTLSGRTIEVITEDQRTRPEKSEVGILLADASKAQRLTGWQSRVTIDEGLARTMEYVARHLNHYRPQEYRT